MKKVTVLLTAVLVAGFSFTSCKKSQPSHKMEGNYSGHFQGVFNGNDTIVNEGYLVTVTAIDKSTVTIAGTLFSSFDALVTKNGINVELVSPTDGLNEFLYEGETKTLSFSYSLDGNIANYTGTKP
ncbi:MAG: hypothetical protein IPM77_16710 [Crocinitomicaceae bacterium]|nr:hypothetical protein [Crocinitomicaceae bacterium]